MTLKYVSDTTGGVHAVTLDSSLSQWSTDYYANDAGLIVFVKKGDVDRVIDHMTHRATNWTRKDVIA